MCVQVHGSTRELDVYSQLISTKCLLVVALMLSAVQGQTTSWVEQPSDRNITVGGSVTFPCRIRTTVKRVVIWNKGTSSLFVDGIRDLDVPARYSIQGNSSNGEHDLHISNVELEDDALYNCQVFSFDSVNVKLTVLLPPGPPEITSNSSSSSYVENSVISFTCSSRGGKPPPTIQWLRNGQPLNSAILTLPSSENANTTSSQLTVTLHRSDHNANYSCVVFNSANQNTPLIQSRILNVQYSPSIHFEPQFSPYHVKLNSPVSLHCVVDSNPPYIALDWYKDGQSISVLSDTKSFNSIEKFDHGNYSCTATNRVAGQLSTSTAFVFVDVIYAPVVTPQRNVVANISTTVNLSCEVVANPRAREIRWDKMGNPGISRNGSSFLFTAEKQYAGNYSCTARSRLEPSGGPAEDVESTGYTQVIIRYPPGRASIRPISAVLVGQRIELECQVDDKGVPSPVYKWWRTDNPNNILQSTGSATYVISSATLMDNANYTCRPSNIMGTAVPDTITVNVNSPPQFVLSRPSDLMHTVPITQSNVTLEHKIEGHPLPIVTWLKDGIALVAMPTMFEVLTTDTYDNFKYTVTTKVKFIGSGRDQNRLRIEDMGNYTCRVTSAATTGSISRNVFLSIEFAPEVTATPRVASNIGDVAELRCSSRANPSPTFHWYRFGQLLSNSSERTLGQESMPDVATYEGYLRIRNTVQGDFGLYECEVTNGKGQARKTLELSRKDKPESPSDLVATENTWESVRLEWTAGFDGGYTQQFYVSIHSLHGNNSVEVYPRGFHVFNVTRLMPQTSYTFYVYGKNALGQGANSIGFTTQTNVLVFPALTKVPEYHVENRKIAVPNNLNQSYCLKVAVSTDSRHTWNVVETCVTADAGEIALDRPGATDVNVTVCLVYRPEVCGDPVSSKIDEATTPDLTKGQVIIIGCVCAAILTILLIILVCIIWRRHKRNKNYTNDPHSPRTVQQGNGALPSQKPRAYDNQDGVHSNSRNGFPLQYLGPADNFPMGNTSFDSHSYDKQYVVGMNMRNANGGGDPYYGEKPGDLSFNGSPRTPTKDPQQFISVPEEHLKEGGSFGSGNESGYSTPDKVKPKKTRFIGPAFFQGNTFFPFNSQTKKKKLKLNPDMVPYSHEPPGHTCGLPCCSEDLQIQIAKPRQHKSCIGIQDCESIQQNFTFKGRLKRQPVLESGFFSVQQQKDCPHAPIPLFGSSSATDLQTINEERKSYPFLKGREITLPESLYLDDLSCGESNDFLEFDDKSSSSNSEIEYYMSVKNNIDPDKGVPYSPHDLENRQLYPWDLLRDMKGNIASKAYSDKTDDSGSSNYYEVLHYPDEKDDNSDTNVPENQGKSKQNILGAPPLPPKLPAQNQFNHPPLKDHIRVSGTPGGDVGGGRGELRSPAGDSDSSLTRYNTYSSVCSINSMANQASKEAIDRYMSLDKSTNSGHKTARTDVRDYDFTGSSTYTVTENMQLSARNSQHKESLRQEGTSKQNKPERNLCLERFNEFRKKKRETEEDEVKLLDKMYTDDDDDDESIINPTFKHINVDGKVLGSRYSLSSLPDSTADDWAHDDILERFLQQVDLGSCEVRSQDEAMLLQLLKERLGDVDSTDMHADDIPITLIL